MKLIVRCLICFPKQLLPPARQDSRQKLAPISLAISARLCFSPGVIRTVNHSVVETRSMLAWDGGRCFQVRVETILKSLGSVVRSSVLAVCPSRVSFMLPPANWKHVTFPVVEVVQYLRPLLGVSRLGSSEGVEQLESSWLIGLLG